VIDLKVTVEGVLIPVLAQPAAKRSAIVKFHAGAVKIAVNQPPDKGRANEAILEVLAKTLDLPLRSLELVAGATSRRKMVLIHGGKPDTIRQALESAIGGDK
jgi:uncharacterized protein (TIGR00251 family)